MIKVVKIWIDEKIIYIQTDTGKIFGERFEDYPRLRNATQQQRSEFVFNNLGIRWKKLDEDFSYDGFITKDKQILEIETN